VSGFPGTILDASNEACSVSSFSHSPKELLSSPQTLGSIWFSGQPLNLFQDSMWLGPQHFIFTQGSALAQPSNLEFD
jgi:hypothetical protein